MFSVCSEEATSLSLEKNVHAYHEQRIGKRFSSKLQENPELDEWRVYAALKDIGIKLSPRTCGRMLALNRSLYGLKGPKKEPNALKEMPFKSSRRHEIWTARFHLSAPRS
jgi:hypothetical protein